MRDNKGFTLIELLAVIVVLAIIALITVPQILGMTTSSRNQASIRSVEGHVRNIENNLALEKFNGKTVDGSYSFDELDLDNYPKKDHVRCESYGINNNQVVEAKNCVINEKNYCYLDDEAVECEELEKTLKNRILGDNTVLTEKPKGEKYVSADKGLYKSTDTNNGQPTYYFKGNVNNNYVKFADNVWRIVRINEDGTVRIILEDAIPIENDTDYVFGTDYKMLYYTECETEKCGKYAVERWYQDNIGNNSKYALKIANGKYFCDALVPESKPYTFVCEMDENGHQYLNSSVGLINFNEAYAASIIEDGQVNDYYLIKNYEFATLSSIGYDERSGGSARYYTMGSNIPIQSGTYAGQYANIVESFTPSKYVKFRPVVNLKAGVKVDKVHDDTLGVDIYVVE